MLPSSTVENYLKVIYLQQVSLADPAGLVPMGHLAGAMGVTPGSATTMVKALSESGLVQYEPYSGVRLTSAGERLAGLVIRRHRLVELFLVRVMGMSWDEVHEEAEQLEHVVSERLIERMDEMLGHPEVDPHGDPIPDAEGIIAHREMQNLLTCPLNVPLTVTRVADQDAAFLRFLEHSQLKPGQHLRVQARDEAADSVRVERDGAEPLTIGTRAASKLLVQVITSLLLVLVFSGIAAFAQDPPDVRGDEPFEIRDNSFFIEEAFNQDANIFQNIVGALRNEGGSWVLGFTQEWPAPTIRHQLSYSISMLGGDGATGAGDVLLNYRYQLLQEDPGIPAISPRVSLIVPVGDEERGLGQGGWGWQFNIPVSKQIGDFYVHGNMGLSWWPSVGSDRFPSSGLVPVDDVAITSPFVGGSVIYRLRPMLNVMLESVVDWNEEIVGAGITDRETFVTFAPGARGGWNFGDKQMIVGAALPITRGGGDTSVGVFGYFSYELPFRR